MARIISLVSYKSGMGKTTTTFHLACGLAMFHDRKILLVDSDPETNLTFLCSKFVHWQSRVRAHGSLGSLYRGFIEGAPISIRDIIWKRPLPDARLQQIDLIPSDISLLDIDLRLQIVTRSSTTIQEVAQTHLDQRSMLSRGLSEVLRDYDYILIDSPPNLSHATQNALYACDGHLVTLQPDPFSTVGLEFLDRKVSLLLRERLLAQHILDSAVGKEMQEGPFFLAFVRIKEDDQMQIAMREQMAAIRGTDRFANRCFDAFTEDSNDIREATNEHTPVFILSPTSRNSRNYRQMTDDFVRSFP